ncbi:hypothetical protein NY607_18360 [Lysinibacillus sp. A4]|nr:MULTISPECIES: hypothetical protein [unclassified Lysinibacillus]MCS5503071.1 hypothetical protein [Lysinibacillus sp. A4]WGT39416.1 hypothetical protein QH639_00885 [Lysinibacillus sp. 1 U-2021]
MNQFYQSSLMGIKACEKLQAIQNSFGDPFSFVQNDIFKIN